MSSVALERLWTLAGGVLITTVVLLSLMGAAGALVIVLLALRTYGRGGTGGARPTVPRLKSDASDDVVWGMMTGFFTWLWVLVVNVLSVPIWALRSLATSRFLKMKLIIALVLAFVIAVIWRVAVRDVIALITTFYDCGASRPIRFVILPIMNCVRGLFTVLVGGYDGIIMWINVVIQNLGVTLVRCAPLALTNAFVSAFNMLIFTFAALVQWVTTGGGIMAHPPDLYTVGGEIAGLVDTIPIMADCVCHDIAAPTRVAVYMPPVPTAEIVQFAVFAMWDFTLGMPLHMGLAVEDPLSSEPGTASWPDFRPAFNDICGLIDAIGDWLDAYIFNAGYFLQEAFMPFLFQLSAGDEAYPPGATESERIAIALLRGWAFGDAGCDGAGDALTAVLDGNFENLPNISRRSAPPSAREEYHTTAYANNSEIRAMRRGRAAAVLRAAAMIQQERGRRDMIIRRATVRRVLPTEDHSGEPGFYHNFTASGNCTYFTATQELADLSFCLATGNATEDGCLLWKKLVIQEVVDDWSCIECDESATPDPWYLTPDALCTHAIAPVAGIEECATHLPYNGTEYATNPLLGAELATNTSLSPCLLVYPGTGKCIICRPGYTLGTDGTCRTCLAAYDVAARCPTLPERYQGPPPCDISSPVSWPLCLRLPTTEELAILQAQNVSGVHRGDCFDPCVWASGSGTWWWQSANASLANVTYGNEQCRCLTGYNGTAPACAGCAAGYIACPVSPTDMTPSCTLPPVGVNITTGCNTSGIYANLSTTCTQCDQCFGVFCEICAAGYYRPPDNLAPACHSIADDTLAFNESMGGLCANIVFNEALGTFTCTECVGEPGNYTLCDLGTACVPTLSTCASAGCINLGPGGIYPNCDACDARFANDSSACNRCTLSSQWTRCSIAGPNDTASLTPVCACFIPFSVNDTCGNFSSCTPTPDIGGGFGDITQLNTTAGRALLNNFRLHLPRIFGVIARSICYWLQWASWFLHTALNFTRILWRGEGCQLDITPIVNTMIDFSAVASTSLGDVLWAPTLGQAAASLSEALIRTGNTGYTFFILFIFGTAGVTDGGCMPPASTPAVIEGLPEFLAELDDARRAWDSGAIPTNPFRQTGLAPLWATNWWRIQEGLLDKNGGTPDMRRRSVFLVDPPAPPEEVHETHDVWNATRDGNAPVAGLDTHKIRTDPEVVVRTAQRRGVDVSEWEMDGGERAELLQRANEIRDARKARRDLPAGATTEIAEGALELLVRARHVGYIIWNTLHTASGTRRAFERSIVMFGSWLSSISPLASKIVAVWGLFLTEVGTLMSEVALNSQVVLTPDYVVTKLGPRVQELADRLEVSIRSMTLPLAGTNVLALIDDNNVGNLGVDWRLWLEQTGGEIPVESLSQVCDAKNFLPGEWASGDTACHAALFVQDLAALPLILVRMGESAVRYGVASYLPLAQGATMPLSNAVQDTAYADFIVAWHEIFTNAAGDWTDLGGSAPRMLYNGMALAGGASTFIDAAATGSCADCRCNSTFKGEVFSRFAVSLFSVLLIPLDIVEESLSSDLVDRGPGPLFLLKDILEGNPPTSLELEMSVRRALVRPILGAGLFMGRQLSLTLMCLEDVDPAYAELNCRITSPGFPSGGAFADSAGCFAYAGLAEVSDVIAGEALNIGVRLTTLFTRFLLDVFTGRFDEALLILKELFETEFVPGTSTGEALFQMVFNFFRVQLSAPITAILQGYEFVCLQLRSVINGFLLQIAQSIRNLCFGVEGVLEGPVDAVMHVFGRHSHISCPLPVFTALTYPVEFCDVPALPEVRRRATVRRSQIDQINETLNNNGTLSYDDYLYLMHMTNATEPEWHRFMFEDEPLQYILPGNASVVFSTVLRDLPGGWHGYSPCDRIMRAFAGRDYRDDLTPDERYDVLTCAAPRMALTYIATSWFHAWDFPFAVTHSAPARWALAWDLIQALGVWLKTSGDGTFNGTRTFLDAGLLYPMTADAFTTGLPELIYRFFAHSINSTVNAIFPDDAVRRRAEFVGPLTRRHEAASRVHRLIHACDWRTQSAKFVTKVLSDDLLGGARRRAFGTRMLPPPKTRYARAMDAAIKREVLRSSVIPERRRRDGSLAGAPPLQAPGGPAEPWNSIKSSPISLEDFSWLPFDNQCTAADLIHQWAPMCCVLIDDVVCASQATAENVIYFYTGPGLDSLIDFVNYWVRWYEEQILWNERFSNSTSVFGGALLDRLENLTGSLAGELGLRRAAETQKRRSAGRSMRRDPDSETQYMGRMRDKAELAREEVWKGHEHQVKRRAHYNLLTNVEKYVAGIEIPPTHRLAPMYEARRAMRRVENDNSTPALYNNPFAASNFGDLLPADMQARIDSGLAGLFPPNFTTGKWEIDLILAVLRPLITLIDDALEPAKKWIFNTNTVRPYGAPANVDDLGLLYWVQSFAVCKWSFDCEEARNMSLISAIFWVVIVFVALVLIFRPLLTIIGPLTALMITGTIVPATIWFVAYTHSPFCSLMILKPIWVNIPGMPLPFPLPSPQPMYFPAIPTCVGTELMQAVEHNIFPIKIGWAAGFTSNTPPPRTNPVEIELANFEEQFMSPFLRECTLRRDEVLAFDQDPYFPNPTFTLLYAARIVCPRCIDFIASTRFYWMIPPVTWIVPSSIIESFITRFSSPNVTAPGGMQDPLVQTGFAALVVPDTVISILVWAIIFTLGLVVLPFLAIPLIAAAALVGLVALVFWLLSTGSLGGISQLIGGAPKPTPVVEVTETTATMGMLASSRRYARDAGKLTHRAR